MKPTLLALASLLAAQLAAADALPLQNGRYVDPVVDLKLTRQQKRAIERYRTCHLERSETMNIYTPYVFTLTPSQAAEVTKKVGFAPRRFQIYETVRGYNDGGPHWNLALRYSEDRFEIPINLLLREEQAATAHRELGWKSRNPCFPAM